MNIKINIYTSFYKKMLQRHKQINDIYIQVSRSLFMPVKGVDNLPMSELIDVNYGYILGFYCDTLEEYETMLRSEDFRENLDDVVSIFDVKNLGITETSIKEELEKATDKEKEELEKVGYNSEELTINFYLLCFEDLETEYTEKDQKKNPDCVAGTKKQCHRKIIAKVLNELYNLDIKEL